MNYDASNRALQTLEKILELPVIDLPVALSQACDLVAEALRADKVDAFLYDPTRDCLVAQGTSHQPLSALQKKLGLDVLQVANGGRAVHVFRTGETFLTGRLLEDPEELRGVKEGMKIQSKVGAPLVVGGVRRGLMMIASLQPDFFTAEDARLAEAVARWVGLVAHRVELTEEIARNAALQGRRAAAEELITVLAHDLRNFLSPIEMRLNLVRRRAERDERANDARDLGLAMRGIERLGALITDILDVARIDQGVFRMEPAPLDLVGLLVEIAGTIATPDHPITCSGGEELVVAADADRLRQCVENLLSNAIKHSPKDAPIYVETARERRGDGDWAKIEVIDQGPGIPGDVLPRIFERFVTNDRRGGLGLGLYLAKRIAEAHRGDLVVQTAEDRGTRFTLRLPIHPEG